MTREEVEKLISLDIDGELAPGDKQRLADALAAHEELALLRRELEAQKQACQTPIPTISPEVLGELETRVHQTYPRKARIISWPTFSKLAIAAALLLAFLAGYYAPRSHPQDANIAEVASTDQVADQLFLAKNEYLAAIEKLERLADSQIEQMPPQVVMQITSNLKEVDRAIAACESFANTYPNQYLAQASLAKAYQAKVDLLETLIDGSFERS